MRNHQRIICELCFAIKQRPKDFLVVFLHLLENRMGFNYGISSVVHIVIITHSILTLKMISSLGQCFDEVWNVVWKVCKRILCFTLEASDYISGASVIMTIRRTNLVAFLNTVKPESSRLAFMTLYIYYTSKGHDSCAMNQENSQLQGKN